MQGLAEKGVATRPGTHAVHTLGYYRDRFGYAHQDLPGASWVQSASIALPLYPQMTDAEQDYVVDMLKTTFEDIGA